MLVNEVFEHDRVVELPRRHLKFRRLDAGPATGFSRLAFVALVVFSNDRRQILHNVVQMEEAFPQNLRASINEVATNACYAKFNHLPQAIELVVVARSLNDAAQRVSETLRRMLDARGQQENFALSDFDVPRLALLHHLEDHIAFDLIENLFTLRNADASGALTSSPSSKW